MAKLLSLQNISLSYDATTILAGLSLDINQGEFISILGPSGCGKTTLLKIIAGFESADSGLVIMDGIDITNTPAQSRNVHTVFQNYALFPHLTVFENIAFALRARKENTKNINSQVLATLKLMSLNLVADRLPSQLSGGQQQRVAIARAIINKPQILLLDESLSALDSHLRKQMQIELKNLQQRLNITFIYVTHSQQEALSMSDRIVVLNKGHIQQVDTPRKVYEEPANKFVASFIGDANVFCLTILESSKNNFSVKIEGIDFYCRNKLNLSAGNLIYYIIRPEDLRVLHIDQVTNSENMLTAIVDEIIYKGSTVDLIVKLASGELLSATEFFDEDNEVLHYTIGEKVFIHWPNGWEIILPYEK